ncbi:hypothetical protein JDV02_002713 [Purpureocillium takamizusanense]|uniref:Uncharacterized protein n=1 Tax=Purpureocillium takamizusanense TaxID=2060973 RepID=A0A9Q8QAV9_9HYPO|nr:uncharacterized protein JDV02_002713 [Purpureocillium takamizusanense]UNI16260.1 hypothetical protein JDV02_002713 [Purpureocillium takamizusanense]
MSPEINTTLPHYRYYLSPPSDAPPYLRHTDARSIPSVPLRNLSLSLLAVDLLAAVVRPPSLKPPAIDCIEPDPVAPPPVARSLFVVVQPGSFVGETRHRDCRRKKHAPFLS